MKNAKTGTVAKCSKYYETNDIRSIGWLNCADGSINLTPCIIGRGQPTFVNIPKSDFDALDGNKELMKRKAVEVLNGRNSNDTLLECELERTEDSYKAIGISTYHLSLDDTVDLDGLAFDRECNMVMKRDTGWFVKLYDSPQANDREHLTEHLKSLFRACLGAGFRMIEFDADASIYHNLQTFD